MALGAVKLYQAQGASRLSYCRFTPSCSNYAAEAIETHGGWVAFKLIARRLLRCRPLAPSGWDPVPGVDEIRDGVGRVNGAHRMSSHRSCTGAG